MLSVHLSVIRIRLYYALDKDHYLSVGMTNITVSLQNNARFWRASSGARLCAVRVVSQQQSAEEIQLRFRKETISVAYGEGTSITHHW